MKPTRAFIEQNLTRIRVQLAAGRALTGEERALLCQAIDRALSGEPNPFGIPIGKPTTKLRDLEITAFVHDATKRGATVEAAKEAATDAAALGKPNRDAVDRAWKNHRAEVVGTNALYLARNEGRQMTEAEQQTFQKGLKSAIPD